MRVEIVLVVTISKTPKKIITIIVVVAAIAVMMITLVVSIGIVIAGKLPLPSASSINSRLGQRSICREAGY